MASKCSLTLTITRYNHVLPCSSHKTNIGYYIYWCTVIVPHSTIHAITQSTCHGYHLLEYVPCQVGRQRSIGIILSLQCRLCIIPTCVQITSPITWYWDANQSNEATRNTYWYWPTPHVMPAIRLSPSRSHGLQLPSDPSRGFLDVYSRPLFQENTATA